MKSFTPEDLLEYYYGEMPPENSADLKERLEQDWALRQKMEVITEAAERLEKSMEPPRNKAIDAILEYAANHHPETTPVR